MTRELFSYFRDEHDIWHLQFHSGTRAAFGEYIETIMDINQKILSGEIITPQPIRILWNFQSGNMPQIQHMVLQSKMNPPPEGFRYRIAYLLNRREHAMALSMMWSNLRQKGIQRKIFYSVPQSDAIHWLLEAVSEDDQP